MLNSAIFVSTCLKASKLVNVVQKIPIRNTVYMRSRKGIDKTSNGSNSVLFFSKKVQHISAFVLLFLLFSVIKESLGNGFGVPL